MSNHTHNWMVGVRTEVGDSVFIAPVFGRTRKEVTEKRIEAHRAAPFGVLVKTSRPVKVPVV